MAQMPHSSPHPDAKAARYRDDGGGTAGQPAGPMEPAEVLERAAARKWGMAVELRAVLARYRAGDSFPPEG